MTKINWNITDQELKQELVSSDNRWHISKTQKGEEESKFFLTNYDLLKFSFSRFVRFAM